MNYYLQLLAAILLSFSFNPQILYSQDVAPKYLIATTVHFDMTYKDGSVADAKALEMEYFEKVTKKNEYIMGANYLTHFFTGDNTEAIRVSWYKSWEDIDKAGTRTEELEKEGWPDETERDAFFEKLDAYYTGKHEDEIMSVLGNVKPFAWAEGETKKPMVYYMRKMHTAWPDEGSEEEIMALAKELAENVTHKNPKLRGNYNYRHAWGADNREITEIYVFENLADVEASFADNAKLAEEYWPDEEKRKTFFKKYNSYFSGWHGDFAYKHVPELRKSK